MNANEIIVGKDYILKIAHNNVKVKVLSHTGHSWIVKTAGGKIMPIQMSDRFVRQVAPAGDVPTGEVPLQTPAMSAETEEPIVLPAPVPTPVPLPVAAPTEPATPSPVTTEKKLSMLDAAAQVLKDAGHPMKIQEILDAMQTSGIWTPGLGKTPSNSLISGIGVEQRRKPHPRFRKTAPGTFEYVGGANHD